MTRIFFIAFMAILCNISIAKAQNPSEYSEFQVYSAALYLAQYRMDLPKDTVHFLLNTKWIAQVDIYLKDLTENPQRRNINLPAMEELGITIDADSRKIEDWLALPFVKAFIKKHKLTVSPAFSRYYSGNANAVTLSSKNHIDWHLMMAYLRDKFAMDETYYSIRMLIADNELWDYYESKPCADKCPNNHFHYNEGVISYGYSYSGMNTGWRHSGWSVNYNTVDRTFSYNQTEDGIAFPIDIELPKD